MCWWNFNTDKGVYDEEMNINQINSFLGTIEKYNPSITLTGAEPLVRKDIPEILGLINDRGIKIASILTNGTLLSEDIVCSIIKSNTSLVQISIDGNEETHDKIRGIKGAHEKALNGIRLLNKVKKALKSQTPDVRVNCVISSENIENLSSLINLAEALDTQLQFQHLMWLDKDSVEMHINVMKKEFGFEDKTIQNLYNNLNKIDTELLLNQIEHIKSECEKRDVPLFFLQFSNKKTVAKWYSDISFVPQKRCLEPFLVARIRAGGEINFCPLIDYSYGSLKEKSFDSLWNNKRAQRIRRELKRRGLFPGCIRCCKL